MPNETMFRQNEVPFDGLLKLGVGKDDFDNLPERFKMSLLNGDVTPVFKANINVADGRNVTIPLRLQLRQDAPGAEPVLVVYPIRQQVENNLGLSDFEMERVNKGEIITKDILDNGRRFPEFIQMDPRTNSLVYVPVARLQMEQELANIESIKDIQLGSNQKDAIREGRPVQLNVGDEKVVVGVDLLQPQGFKVIRGDMEEWKRQQEELYDIAHPEFMGFVKTDQNRWEYQKVMERDNAGDNTLDKSQNLRSAISL